MPLPQFLIKRTQIELIKNLPGQLYFQGKMKAGNWQLGTGNWVSSQFNCNAIFTCQRRWMMPCHNVKWIILVCKCIQSAQVPTNMSVHTHGPFAKCIVIIMVIRKTVAFVCPSLSATLQSELHVDNDPKNHELFRKRAANSKQMDTE